MKLNKERILILTQTDPEKDMMFKNWISAGYSANIIFSNVNKFLRGVRRIWMNSFLPGKKLWLKKEWLLTLDNYDAIILHANNFSRHIPKIIHKQNKDIKIIYWYWNIVTPPSSPKKVTDSDVEMWTFDELDAQKYKMKTNVQYYSEFSVKKSANICQDVYFIGHDKGRRNQIKSLQEEFKSRNISSKLDIIDENAKALIPYDKVCDNIARSKAILEINQEGQRGYTLRAMEALFFEKKLITNNKHICHEDFYSKNNIFILGMDDLDRLSEFVNSKYDESVNVYKNKYNIDAWVNNFFSER